MTEIVYAPRRLLFAVTSHSADDGILLSSYAVGSTLGVPSGLASSEFRFTRLQDRVSYSVPSVKGKHPGRTACSCWPLCCQDWAPVRLPTASTTVPLTEWYWPVVLEGAFSDLSEVV